MGLDDPSAINNDGRFGRWSFLEIAGPTDAGHIIRAHLRGAGVA